jgi:hypothetical protein
VFAQGAKCVEAERLVDEDGQSVYVTEENLRKYGALPLAFLHGKENELFHYESAISTARLFAQIQPQWETKRTARSALLGSFRDLVITMSSSVRMPHQRSIPVLADSLTLFRRRLIRGVEDTQMLSDMRFCVFPG